jgi:micrococcal nuclease
MLANTQKHNKEPKNHAQTNPCPTAPLPKNTGFIPSKKKSHTLLAYHPIVRAVWALPAVVWLLLACTPNIASSAPSTPSLPIITHVTDGDTLVARLPSGADERVRILAVDAPEISSPNRRDEYPGISNVACLDRLGREAAAYLEAQVLNKPVALTADPWEGERDAFGRMLAYVELAGADIGSRLVALGYARVYTEGKAARENAYLALQQQARSERKGLWSCAPASATSPSSSGAVTIASVDTTAEVVVIENRSPQPVDLKGWTLISEMGNQRFNFPSLILQPGATVRVTSGPNSDHNPPSILRWTTSNVWNNTSDPAILLDPTGKEVYRH